MDRVSIYGRLGYSKWPGTSSFSKETRYENKSDLVQAAFVIIFPLIASILQLLILPFCHESPNYLKMIDREKFIAAKDFYGVSCNQYDNAEKSEKRSKMLSSDENNSISSLMKDPLFTKPLGIGCTMMLIQQLTGIRSVFLELTYD